MNDYLQPEFYRFSEDSLRLVSYVATRVTSADSLADLGAGCGVVGLELALKLHPRRVELVEAQEEFLPFLTHNAGEGAVVRHERFAEWSPPEKFDLIVSNPPYFLPGHGQSSGELSRHRCRTFELDGWEGLLAAIERGLQPTGRAFVMIPRDHRVLALVRRILGVGLDEKRDHALAHLLVLELTKQPLGLGLEEFVLW